MKKRNLSFILLSILLSVAMLMSCADNPNSDGEALARVSFGSPSSRSLSAAYDQPNEKNLFWYYKSTKTDGGLNTGATAEWKAVSDRNPGLSYDVGPFSVGTWTFELAAFAEADSKDIIYSGSVEKVDLKANGVNQVTVPVKYVAKSGTGTINFNDITFDTNSNVKDTKIIVSAKNVTDESTILEPKTVEKVDGVYNLTENLSAGVYTFTFDIYVDSLEVDSVTKTFIILANRTATVTGTISENTAEGSFKVEFAEEYYYQSGAYFQVGPNDIDSSKTLAAIETYLSKEGKNVAYLLLNGDITLVDNTFTFNQASAVSRDITLPADKKIVINLDGYSIKSENSAAIVVNGANLTVEIVDDSNKGTISSTSTSAIKVESGNLIVSGGNITTDSETSAAISTSGNLEIAGGIIKATKAIEINHEESGVKISGGTISADNAVVVDENVTTVKPVEVTGGIVEGMLDNKVSTVTGGTGTESEPYRISTAEQLGRIGVSEAGRCYQLANDIELDKPLIIPVALTLDLNKYTITSKSIIQLPKADQSYTVKISNGNLNFIGRTTLNNASIDLYTNSKLILDSVILDSCVGGIHVAETNNTVGLEVKDSKITANGYMGISTNASKEESSNISIFIENSEIITAGDTDSDGDNTAMLFNVKGIVKISNSTLKGDRHGLILRGGGAENTHMISNSTIEATGKNSINAYYLESKWGSGNEVPLAALVIGNRSNADVYPYGTNVTLDNVTVITPADEKYHGIYVYQNNATYPVTVKGTLNSESTNKKINTEKHGATVSIE